MPVEMEKIEFLGGPLDGEEKLLPAQGKYIHQISSARPRLVVDGRGLAISTDIPRIVCHIYLRLGCTMTGETIEYRYLGVES